MALIPTWYSASTKQIAEKALQRGVLKYPGLCYIQDSKSIAWVTIDNTLEYVKGDKQITDVKCIGSNLMFFSGDKLLFSYDISMTDEDKDHIIEEVKKTIGLDNYVKSSELSTLLDNIIGNLEDKSTVVDYINSLSYNKLFDVPIVNLIGTLTVPVKISSLDDGIYKVKGQCIIGGNNTTVQSSADDVLYLVSHDADTSSTTITKMQGKSITLYFIQQDGEYTTDRYITESWINEQNFASADSVKEYVSNIIEETVLDVLDEHIDAALDRKLGGIDNKYISRRKLIMAKLQFATLSNLQEFLNLHNVQIDSKISEAVKNSIKTVSQSEDGYTLYFYTKTAPVTIDEAAFTITIPQPTGKADKVKGAISGHLAGLDANGNLVDSGKAATDFDAAGAANTAKTEVMSYVGTIPADAKAKDVVSYIKEAVKTGTYDDSALKASVAANTAAIGTLNGTGDGSVKKAVADAVAKIVADAPEAYDTLKEISDWISTHTSDAATMNSQIKTNKEDITKLKTLIGTLPESATSKDIVSYIAEYVSKALADSDLSQYAKAADLEAAVGRIDTIEKKLPTLEAADKKNAEDITAVKGRMDTAEGKITAVEKDLATEKPKIAKNTSDITALKGLVGDGYEAIPSASIKGLFTA